jgi:hypothetical protein
MSSVLPRVFSKREKTPDDVPESTFASAELWRARGYFVMPVHAGETMPRGPWCFVQVPWNPYENRKAGIALACTAPPPRGPGGVENYQATRVLGLQVELKAEGKKLRELSARVEAAIASCLRWRDRKSRPHPVRTEKHPGRSMRVYQLDAGVAPFADVASLKYATGSASVICANRCIVLADGDRYQWTEGGLRDRADLPVMNFADAHRLINAIEDELVRRV